MFLLALILVPLLEVLVFIEVAGAIGWLLALALLLLTSVLGMRVLRSQGRLAIGRVTQALSERRPPGRPAAEGLLGFLGGVLLAIPGFLTDALGVLLLLTPTRRLAGRWISRHYGGRVMRFAATTGRFAAGTRRSPPADVDATAFEEDIDQLGR